MDEWTQDPVPVVTKVIDQAEDTKGLSTLTPTTHPFPDRHQADVGAITVYANLKHAI